jgi:NAD(P)H-flavin reductase
LAKKHPERFSVTYTVDRSPAGGAEWSGSVGYVNADMLKKAGMPMSPADGVMMMVCGAFDS